MQQNDFLRFALILSSGQAATFKKNLEKIIKLILWDSYSTPLSSLEISRRAKDVYSLSFSADEIEKVIIKSHSNSFVINDNKYDPFFTTYTITPDENEKLNKSNDSDQLLYVIHDFQKSFKDEILFSEDQLREIILRYIYDVFNSDTKTVLSLMNYHSDELQIENSSHRFTIEEANCINKFLNWDNPQKNKLVYTLISSCYEFCMMTVKKDNNSYSSVFRGKMFFLDTNVIFRLAGFNNNERKEVITSFLDRCRKCGISINYTNFTNVEIEKTLKHRVHMLSQLFHQSQPVRIEAFDRLSSKYSNNDFYAIYVEWTKNPINKIGDYESFLSFLKRDVTKYLNDMNFVRFDSFEECDKLGEFDNECTSLRNFKLSTHKDFPVRDSSIKIDIENYLYLKKLNSSNSTNSFAGKKYYLISTDQAYIEWAKAKCPGEIPTIVLPSVWYSLMLKYSGRADDDYGAFCQFLTLRLSNEDELSDKKEEMLAYIISLNESAEIKEEIIFDIDERLKHEPNDIENIEMFVEESHNKITQRAIDQKVTVLNKEHQKEKEALLSKTQMKLAETKLEGINEGKTHVIKAQAKQKVARNKKIRIIAIVLGIFGVVIFTSTLIISYVSQKGIAFMTLSFISNNSIILSITSAGISAISFLFSRLNKYINILSIDEDVVVKEISKKLGRYKI